MDKYIENQIKRTKQALGEWEDFPAEEKFHIERLRKTAKYIARKMKKDTAVLDVGCRNGQLMDALRKSGFKDIIGIDISPEAVELTKAKGYEAYVMDIHDMVEWGRKRFDLIVLIHVLEHCHDPSMALKNVDTLLKKEGRVIIEVPIQEQQETPTKYMHYHIFDSAPYLLEVALSCGFVYIEDKPNSWGCGAFFRKKLERES